jgi:dolichol kinase
MDILLTVLAVLALLVVNELWWHKRAVHGELSRKFIHITVGSFVAFWPFYLSWLNIRELSLAFIVVVALSKYFKLFQAIHAVQRPTWGEIFFALAVGATTLITQDKWIYMAAVLQMSLADGLAAVIGSHQGKRGLRYSVFGHPKSLVGTGTFFVTSVLILAGYSHWSGHGLGIAWIILGSAAASIIENFGVKGLDNLLVPLLVVLILTNA